MARHAMIIGPVRFSFLALAKPKAVSQGGAEKYQVCILIPKTDKATIRKINELVNEAIADGASVFKKTLDPNKLPRNFEHPLHDGDEERESDDFANHYYMNCYANRKPGIVDKNRDEILDITEEIYSGCWGRVDVNLYAYNVSSPGIAVGLNNVQKIKDGPRLDGVIGADKAFDDGFEPDDDEDDFKPERGSSSRSSGSASKFF